MAKKVFKKKEEIREILSGAARLSSSLITPSALMIHCQSSRPASYFCFVFILHISVTLCVAAGGLVWSLKMTSTPDYTFWFGPSGMIIGILGFSEAMSRYFRKLNNLKSNLAAPVDELRGLNGYLEGYLREMRTRTQRHFTAVTGDVLTNLVFLSSAKRSLAELIAVADRLLASSTYLNLILLDDILRGCLKIYEGAELRDAKQYQISFTILRDTLEELITNLNIGTAELEKLPHTDYRADSQPRLFD